MPSRTFRAANKQVVPLRVCSHGSSSHHVGELLHKALVLRHLEGPDPMWLQSVSCPYPVDGDMADSHLFGQGPGVPVGRTRRLGVQRALYNQLHCLSIEATKAGPMRRVLRNTPPVPCSAKRLLHRITVGRDVFNILAIKLFAIPSAAIRQMRDRKTTLWGVVFAFTQDSNVFRCSIVIARASVGFHMLQL